MPPRRPRLFWPLTLRDVELANRIVVSPMDQYRAVDGCMGDWHLMHLGQFAKSGAGLVITEAMHVEPEGRITHACAGLYSDDNEQALARVLSFCRTNGFAKLGVQIVHAGRKASTQLPHQARNAPLTTDQGGWAIWGCSGQPYGDGWPAAQVLNETGIARVIDAHVQATCRAARAGADLLDLVMAHGYLLHEFLSPLSNHRDDAYGGSFDNRVRFPLAVFDAVRAAWPSHRPLGVRISVDDNLPGGWNTEQSIKLVRLLKGRGCDYLCVSSGGLSLSQRVNVFEGHQVPHARMIRETCDIPVMTVGMIQDPRHADAIVAEGDADLVALARAFLQDPHWPWYAAAVLDADIPYPQEYVRGYRSRWHRAGRGTPGRSGQDDEARTATPFGAAGPPERQHDT